MTRKSLVALASSTLALVATLAPAPGAQQVLTVDDDGPADFTTLQAAVDAAGPLDVVLVRPGSYDGFSTSGPTTVVADDGGDVVVGTLVLVADTAGDAPVLLSGLQLDALHVFACAGPVWVQEGAVTMAPIGSGGPVGAGLSVWIWESEAVVFTRVRIEPDEPDALDAALLVEHSNVVLHDCLVDVGDAPPNLDGKPGVLVDGGALFASGSILRGGAGGDHVVLGATGDGSDGGPALEVTSGAARLLGCLLEGGAGGAGSGPGVDGADAPPYDAAPGAVVDVLAGDARVYDLGAVVREGGTTLLRVEGHPGESAWLLAGLSGLPSVIPVVAWQGVFVPGTPVLPLFLGNLPAGGVIAAPVTLGALPAGVEAARLDTQAILGGAGAWTLGTPRMLWLVDAGL